jgi:hypothetical protein
VIVVVSGVLVGNITGGKVKINGGIGTIGGGVVSQQMN